MSSLTTTTVNTRDGSTNLTLRTGNTSGPSIIVTPTHTVTVSANSTMNVIIANTSSLRVNTATTIANTLTISSNVTAQANLSVTGAITGANATLSTNTLTLGTSSIANPGYSRMPNGLLMQWGNASVNSSSGSVTFPAAFSAVYTMQLTPSVSTVGNTLPAVTALTTTTATLRSANATASTVYWLAIGV